MQEQEVTALVQAAGQVGRHGARDATLILLAYRHGLRVSELVSLRWDQVDLQHGLLHVTRRKHGIPSVHPLRGPELRALRRLQRDYPASAYLFVSERKAPLTTDAVRKIVGRAGRQAGLAFPVHPHMLRHATGYKLANEGQGPIAQGCLPRQVAGLVKMLGEYQALAASAAWSGTRQEAIQALAGNPLVLSLHKAQPIYDEMAAALRGYLPARLLPPCRRDEGETTVSPSPGPASTRP